MASLLSRTVSESELVALMRKRSAIVRGNTIFLSDPFWSPFENGTGNHNVSTVGKSGSCKSLLLQERCAALLGAGAKVVVIDDDRSFMNSVKLQGGAFIEFTMQSGFCLNPFSMVDAGRIADDEDYKLYCLAMLSVIVGQMARFIDKLNDAERGLIDAAVNSVWETLGNAGSVDDVAKALTDAKSRDARKLALAMSPFCNGGTYGGFFIGQSTLKLEADFTVFELSDLATHEELRGVVLTTILFMTTQMMTVDAAIEAVAFPEQEVQYGVAAE